jgi:peptide deformylase
MIRQLVHGNHPVLHRRAPEFGWLPAEIDVLRDLIHTATHLDGLGLAAPQIGEGTRAFAWRTKVGFRVMCNPTIVAAAGVSGPADETCFSFPGVKVSVSRPLSGRVRWMDENQAEFEAAFRGLEWRCILHELDHLNGVTILDHKRGKAQ